MIFHSVAIPRQNIRSNTHRMATACADPQAFFGSNSVSERLKAEKQAPDIANALQLLKTNPLALDILQLVAELKETRSFKKKLRRLFGQKRVSVSLILDHFRPERKMEVLKTLGQLCANKVLDYTIIGYQHALRSPDFAKYYPKINAIALNSYKSYMSYMDRTSIIQHLDKAREEWHSTGELVPPSNASDRFYQFTPAIFMDFIEATIYDFKITPVGKISLEKIRREGLPEAPDAEPTPPTKSLD